MEEIIFLVEESQDGGYTARAMGHSIFTDGDDIDDIKKNIIDAIDCHFDEQEAKPKIVRLHIVKDELFSYA